MPWFDESLKFLKSLLRIFEEFIENF